MPLDQQRIVQVARDDACLVLDNIAQTVDDVYSTAARRRRWLYDPVVEAQRPYSTWLDLSIWHHNLVLDCVLSLIKALAESFPLFW